MARPRTPLAKAQITGQAAKNPKRFKARSNPPSAGPLGKPPAWMKEKLQIEAWHTFETELPWVDKSHRSIIEIASLLRARLMTGNEVGVKAMTLLRQCLGSLGATPSDASKIALPEESDDADPSAKYF